MQKQTYRIQSRIRITWLCLAFVFLGSGTLLAQSFSVSGTVRDAAGETLPGVSVVVKGTAKGTITDMDGNYTLTNATGSETLVFSFIGMETQEVALKNKQRVDVVMQTATIGLEEIVAIGYGTVKKPDLTGSVGVAPVTDMAKAAAVSSFTESLAGRMAGVQVSASDGQPGSEMNIVIRGVSSLTQSNTPLYVIDGFPVENPSTVSLNPEEIESLTVLKDASSTAIYGSRGANGVILIQTKRGKAGKQVINFSSSMGYQLNPDPVELMSPYEFVKYQVEFNPVSYNTPAYFADGKTLEDYRDVKGNNFQDYLLRTGKLQTHNLSIRGGTEQTKYSISGSIFDQEGVIINTGLKRYTGRVTLDHSVSKKIKVGITVNTSDVKQYGQVVSQSPTVTNPTTYILARTWMYRPVSYNPDVDILDEFFDDNVAAGDYRVNPLLDMRNQHQIYKLNQLNANGYISYEIAKGLTFKATAGMLRNDITQERFSNSKTSQGGAHPGNLNGVNGSILNRLSITYSNEYTLTYKTTIKKDHTITALGLFSLNGTDFSSNGYSSKFLPNEQLGMDGLDEGVAYDPISGSSQNTMVSYAGRLDYNYKSKYIITGTFRADGSSKFIDHWGYFPGVAFAWNMHKEVFFKSLFPFVSTSKFRVSYGSNGNNQIGDFEPYQRLVQTTNGYSFNNQTPTGGVYVAAVGNPALRWEKLNTLDMGYEIGLFKDRISFEVDLYRKTTEDLLLNAILPPTTGFAAAVKNIGKMRNEGLEFTLNTVNVSKRLFSWKSNFNISFNRNKVMELADGQKSLPTQVPFVSQYSRPLYLAEIGKPAGMMIGYIWEGNYQFEDFDSPAPDVYVLKPSVPTNGTARSSIQPGDIKYRDLNGDGIVSDADVTFIGRGQPIHTGGFTNNFTYKGFTLSAFFQWSYGNDIYNANRLIFEGNGVLYANTNQFASYANRWTPENPTNENFRARGQGPIGFHNSKVVEDGSYLRFKTLSLSYSIPAKYIKKAYLSSLSLNFSAQNVAVWTNYSGMDPEVSVRNSALTPGFDYSSYPKSPTYVFGVNMAF
ncbi:SusC/RagA family TonB-linked outer membrane protein [Gaoshiqia sp. Z1-71]|uniref:SusC/RagA family TonB-linked outer membrane protein n=1 Tax=Gaoshiqia hydrogeniformans TaxID=3290090 RepID=UPI003BF863B6